MRVFMATYEQVIERFVERFYNATRRPIKSGNYEIHDDKLLLFGNRIAWYESDKINYDYRGPYSGSKTTRRALNKLKWEVDKAATMCRQAMLFQYYDIAGYVEWRELIPDDQITEAVCGD